MPMTFPEFQAHTNEFIEKMRSIMGVKNADYSVNDDCMSNYTEIAKWLGVPPRTVWGVLFFKHITAIARYVRDGRVESEGIHHRMLDAANYCVLGSGLVKSEDQADDPRGYDARPASPGIDAIKDYAQALIDSIVNYSAMNPINGPLAQELLKSVTDLANACELQVGMVGPPMKIDVGTMTITPAVTNSPPEERDWTSLTTGELAEEIYDEMMSLPSLDHEHPKNVAKFIDQLRTWKHPTLADKIIALTGREESLTLMVKWVPFCEILKKMKDRHEGQTANTREG